MLFDNSTADSVNVGWTQSFAYDGLNRLTSAFRSDSGYNHTYNYDSFGNLTIHDNITPGPTYNINPATNQLNRWNSVTNAYNTYTYDAAGNLINSGTSDIGGHSFTYDGFGRINAVDSGAAAAYGFNGIDERIFKQTAAGWTDYMYLNSQPIAEWAQDGAWTDYIYAEGQKIAKVATSTGGASTLNYYLDDHLGTTQVELDASGNVTWQGQFTPFGSELPDGSTTMHYKFTGKERDSESGLDYFGARYYASANGRWLSPDWAENPEAVPYSNLSSPQTLNLYGYVGNNPLRQADLDGHIFDGSGDSGGSISGGYNGHSIKSYAEISAEDANAGYQQSQAQHQAQQQNQNLSPTDKVALKAEQAALGPTRESVEEKNSHEYGGLIVKNNKSGKISSTDPVRGNGISIDVDSIPVPAGTTVIATYHSHPHSSAVEDGGASQGDVNNSAAHNNRPGYVLDSFSGRVYRYDGHTDARPFPAGTYIGTVQ